MFGVLGRKRQKAQEEGIEEPSEGNDTAKFWLDTCTPTWRIRRFFATFRGFYEGSLDLTGRTERRWNSLKPRMISFLEDLDILKQHATRTTSVAECPVLEGMEPHKITTTKYQLDPELSAIDILKKYRMNDGALLDEIFPLAEQMKGLLSSESQPIFQKLFLLDLPPEIIHHVMELTDVEGARLLGATCHAMYDISLSHKYKCRYLALKFNPDMESVGVDTSDEIYMEKMREYLHSHLFSTLQELSQDITFLLSRTDITQRIRNLSLGNQWSSDHLALAGLDLSDDPNAYATFFAPVCKGFESVLTRASDVVDLCLSTTISPQMLFAMAAMANLRTLEIIDCRFSTRPQTQLPRLTSVINASFIITSDDDDDADEVLLLLASLPNLRMLCVDGSPYKPFRMHQIGFDKGDEPPRRIERISLAQIARDQLPVLGIWIRRAAELNDGRSCLTHFKLEVEYGLGRDELADLISALRGAPMDTLILDGLAYVGLDLFADISSAFPGLRSLTLFRRENSLQRRCSRSRWPEPSWTYASYLSRFTNLQHFGWNFDINPYCVYSPRFLLLMENGYSTESWESVFQSAADECFTEWECLARLFAAYCATLQSLSFAVSDVVAIQDFSISRDNEGKVTVDTFDINGSIGRMIVTNPAAYANSYPWLSSARTERRAPHRANDLIIASK
ncbi:uncharacterized protein FIBRA_08572 [Fibroporia radiculosa]|uniref:F-box domain-containing protein n=1 Tax=Fibroporia radiculosa TaxID=599839 RepID=J4GX20_9APHY|nr:uncharacterized protein FIBRA_08572 [Fibroporia radiculosa]CCM06320.1 predicted protein [Fibroporia radiculosa]